MIILYIMIQYPALSITWAHVDPDLCLHMESLVHNELIVWCCFWDQHIPTVKWITESHICLTWGLYLHVLSHCMWVKSQPMRQLLTFIIPYKVIKISPIREDVAFVASYHVPKVWASEKTLYRVVLQSSAVITRSNIVRYYKNDYRSWGKISFRCWIHKRHPIPRPNGRAMVCLLWIFVRKLTAL